LSGTKAHYQAFFWVLIDLIVELLVLIIKPFDNHYFLDSLVSPWLHLADKIEDHFDTRQVVRSVSHFVYEFVEFVIVLGHGQSPILSNKPLDKLDATVRLLQ
jgi:hypothetical protein